MEPGTVISLPSSRPLPVILLADVSGSMSVDSKIDVLNTSVAEMIAAFAAEDHVHVEIQVGVITFGGETAHLHQPLVPANQVSWSAMQCDGRTPLGKALDMARQIVEDRDHVPSRAYKPTLVLISDGHPTDDWRTPMGLLLASERGAKSDRFAVAIGADADTAMLQEFVGQDGVDVFMAHEARQIAQYFRWITMSVTMRSRGQKPTQTPDDFEFDF